jgi:hypothetical protein
MNQGGYFGAYRQGFQTMPDNAYEMMTAPTKQIAGAVTDTLGKLVSAYAGYRGQQAGAEALKKGAAVQYKSLESLSKATGVPVNAELTEQFKNMKRLNPQEQTVFNQSLGQEAQNMMTRYNINLAQSQSQQAQRGLNYQSLGQSLDVDPYTPPPLPTTQNAQGGIEPSILPPYPNLVVPGYGDRIGPLRPMNQRY